MQAISKAELSFSAPERTARAPAGQLVATAPAVANEATGTAGKGAKVRATLRARLGEDIYTSWFNALEFDEFDGKTVKVSVPVKFLRKWIQSHYLDELLACCRSEFKTAEIVEVPCSPAGWLGAAPCARAGRAGHRRCAKRQQSCVRWAASSRSGPPPFPAPSPGARASTASRALPSIPTTHSRTSSSALRTAWPMQAPCRLRKPC